jgi:hypothetical protein
MHVVAKDPDMDRIVEEFHKVLDLACRSSLKNLPATKTASTHKSPGGQKNLQFCGKG